MTMNINGTLAALETASEKTAKALVRRSDIKVVATGTDAFYDWKAKVLHVPAYSIREDATEDHVWAWRGLLDHECAHVEHSDGVVYDAYLEQWTSTYGRNATSRIMMIANAFEDPYIEREWVKCNPGSIKHLKACGDLVIRETGRELVCHPDYVPVGAQQPVGFFTAFIQSLLRVGSDHVGISEIDPNIRQLMEVVIHEEIADGLLAKSSDDVCQIAERVWIKLKDLMDQEDPDGGQGEGQAPSEDDNGQSGTGEGSGQGAGQGAGEEGSDGDDSDGEGSEGDDSDGEGEGDDSDGEGNGSDGEGDDSDGDDSDGGDSDGEGDGSEGDKSKSQSGSGDESKGKGDKARGNQNQNQGGADKESRPSKEGSAGFSDLTGKDQADVISAAELCCGGDYGEVKSAGQVVANQFVQDAATRPYTVHPKARAKDRWTSYDTAQRRDAKPAAASLRKAAGPAITTMANLLRCAVKAQKQTLWVGGLDEGEEIDPAALPNLAMGFNDSRVFADRFNQLDDNTFVCVLVDCSGSMGRSAPEIRCPDHGTVDQKGTKCSRKDRYTGKRCNKPLTPTVATKSGYAAMTAAVLHDALRLCEVQHTVLGYTNTSVGRSLRGEQEWVQMRDVDGSMKKVPKWSRLTSANWMHEFVPAPGISDDGGAIPYITGYCCNLDGESILEAAKYSVKAAKNCDRVVMIVIADGLPAGADDGELEGRYLRDSVEIVAQAGVEVYGIGVGINYQQKAYESFYPKKPANGNRAATGHVLIRNGEGLSNAVMRQLTDLLVRSNGRRRR